MNSRLCKELKVIIEEASTFAWAEEIHTIHHYGIIFPTRMGQRQSDASYRRLYIQHPQWKISCKVINTCEFLITSWHYAFFSPCLFCDCEYVKLNVDFIL